jgi:hypothetical protein
VIDGAPDNAKARAHGKADEGPLETADSAADDMLQIAAADSSPGRGAAQPDPEQGAEEGSGRLAPEARRAVVALLKHGAVLAADKRMIFEAIERHRAPLEAHLADMYLHLLIDERAGVALILQKDPDEADGEEDESSTSLITRRSLTLYETLLMLVLRKHYQDRQTSGEQSVFIDLERIEAGLTPFLPLTTSTRSDRQKLSGALENMVKRKVLARARGTQDRFEITPVIRYVVNAASLEHLLAQYTSLLKQSLGDNDESVATSAADGDDNV